ncbi:serine acetyltransferase 5-like [Henckelia pumila]|uniref:serine acetyltransferase 5-like n=1 Tax=Henckelia pumila TaxID=405737 RepID=UPI003C6E31E4
MDAMPVEEFRDMCPPPGSEEAWVWVQVWVWVWVGVGVGVGVGVWAQIKAEARSNADAEPALASYLYSTILAHSSLERSLSFHLGNMLGSATLPSMLLHDLFLDIFSTDDALRAATVADLRASRSRDPACISFSHCLLSHKGFLACQAHRVAHKLWTQSRRPLALALQSRVSVFAVDIHPAAIMGGTEKIGGDRHPKIGDGVLFGAGATILGGVKIGEGATIEPGSVVLFDVPPRTTAVGNPAIQ